VEVLILGPARPERVAVFAAGAGGNPERHLPLLECLADNGVQVIAPYFARLSAPDAGPGELLLRPTGLVEALREHASADAAVVAIGHSIGGWAALCLAGGKPVGRDGTPLAVPREPRVDALVLYAPAAGWFAPPGALTDVTARMLVYAAELDTVTPVEQVAVLQHAPGPVDLRVVPRAGHFSFMHTLPPGVSEDSAFDRDTTLSEIARSTVAFVNA
jgi:pimeloyl-ACP methyl ester carboxylesterase